MTTSPTPSERLAIRTANAALLDSPDASCDIVATIVFALGAAGQLQSPEKAAELTRRRNEDLALRGELAPSGGQRAVPMELGPSLVPAVQWLTARVAELQAERDAHRAAAGCTCIDAPELDAGALLHASYCVTSLEDPHDSPLHREYRTCRDLPAPRTGAAS